MKYIKQCPKCYILYNILHVHPYYLNGLCRITIRCSKCWNNFNRIK